MIARPFFKYIFSVTLNSHFLRINKYSYLSIYFCLFYLLIRAQSFFSHNHADNETIDFRLTLSTIVDYYGFQIGRERKKKRERERDSQFHREFFFRRTRYYTFICFFLPYYISATHRIISEREGRFRENR